MSSLLKTFNVVPMLANHEAELAADAKKLLEDGVCTDLAAMFTLVPEGNPVVDKAGILGDRYRIFREKLGKVNGRVGILAQATIGHGWTPDEPVHFQKIVTSGGHEPYMMCPLGKPFLSYLYQTFLHIAELEPDFCMIDDDFRLITGRGGCFCPLHLAAFGARTGLTYTRESLTGALARDPELAREFDQMQLESLLEAARVIRSALDKVNPAIAGSFCTCTRDIHHANAITEILTGKNQPRIVRINNARYMCSGNRDFPHRMYVGAIQITGVSPATTVLAETDTFPQNRYSTGAVPLHAHYTGSLLEGCAGAKHWLTRICAYEPASGAAYRDILRTHRFFYETLFQTRHRLKAVGYAAAALPRNLNFGEYPARTWASSLVGLMGLPCNYLKNPRVPVMMTGDEVPLFSDMELREFLVHGMILDGEAAYSLSERGFDNELGVHVRQWNGKRVSGELRGDLFMRGGDRYFELKPLNPRVSVDSQLIHQPFGGSANHETLGPGAVTYENIHGGRVAIFAGTPGEPGYNGFSFLNETRKKQLVAMLEYVCKGRLDFYYPGDAEIFLKYGKLDNHTYFLSLLNLGLDELEEIPLNSGHKLNSVELLEPTGSWRNVELHGNVLETRLSPMLPLILKVDVD